MKIVDLTCPHCGANLKVDSSATEYTCEYCGSKVLLDNGSASKLTVDNAEESGYQFEKGRIRAQREAARQYRSNTGNNQTQQPKKKSKTWLWVLGWIFIFPVPLTIIMLRKKEMKPSIKYGIIAASWIVYLIIASPGNSNQISSTVVAVPSPEPTIQSTSSETSNGTIYYEQNEVVNAFIADYNSIEEIPITEIRQGHVSQVAYAYIGDVFIMMRDCYGTSGNSCYKMSIDGGNSIEKTDSMFEVFKKVVKVLDTQLTDDQIDEAIANWRAIDYLGDYTLGDLSITYVPYKESVGNTSRIDIYSSSYAKP